MIIPYIVSLTKDSPLVNETKSYLVRNAPSDACLQQNVRVCVYSFISSFIHSPNYSHKCLTRIYEVATECEALYRHYEAVRELSTGPASWKS